eukprot:jgi/Mesvir1/22671/Mv14101-RA.1
MSGSRLCHLVVLCTLQLLLQISKSAGQATQPCGPAGPDTRILVTARDVIFLAGQEGKLTVPAVDASAQELAVWPIPRGDLTGYGPGSAPWRPESIPKAIPVCGGDVPEILTFNLTGEAAFCFGRARGDSGLFGAAVTPRGTPTLCMSTLDGGRLVAGGDPLMADVSVPGAGMKPPNVTISGYQGPHGALVGMFLGPETPASGGERITEPATVDFRPQGIGSTFRTLYYISLGQVFYIGDGLDDAGRPQQFVVPRLATRLFLGVADTCGKEAGVYGCYVDNSGSAIVRVHSTRGCPGRECIAQEQCQVSPGTCVRGACRFAESEEPQCILPLMASELRFQGACRERFLLRAMGGAIVTLISDPYLHINAELMEVDGSDGRMWVRAVGLLFGPHRVVVSSVSLPTRALDDAHGTVIVNGKVMPPRVGSRTTRTLGLSVLRKKGHVELSVDGMVFAHIAVVAASTWRPGSGPGRNFLNVAFKFLSFSSKVHGLLGQTYARSSCDGVKLLNRSPSGEGSFVGRVSDYAVSGLLESDCKFSRYQNLKTGEMLELDQGQFSEYRTSEQETAVYNEEHPSF